MDFSNCWDAKYSCLFSLLLSVLLIMFELIVVTMSRQFVDFIRNVYFVIFQEVAVESNCELIPY